MRPYVSLRGRREFATTMRRGASASAPLLTVHAFSPPAKAAGAPKVGIIVTRKVGKAVVRNRIRRRCKAILETLLARDDARWFVVTCKPAAAQARFAELQRQLTSAMPTGGKARGKRA
jgi:ribonuclease P protein component